MTRAFVALCVVAVIATSCANSASAPDTTSVASACDAATPIVETDGALPEVQGVAVDATVYGLLFPIHGVPIRSSEDGLKIVWRMTGEGDLSVSYESPNGTPGDLTFGPEPHSSSSFTRPGDEWGTGFLLNEPGCWHIHLERTVGSGDVWIDVVSI